jgi:AcrR family transcriptional regulator
MTDQLAASAIAMLDADPNLSVADVAHRFDVSMPVIYRHWRRLRPGTVPRGMGSHKAKLFARVCDAACERLTEPMTGAEVRALVPGIRERTLHRALRRLIETGRVERTRAKGEQAKYRRKT